MLQQTIWVYTLKCALREFSAMDEEQKDGKIPVTPPAVIPPVIPQNDDLLVETDDVTWEHAVERSKKPVVVMFYSPTCVFCHQMEPYFRSYAGEYRDSVIFVRLNILTSQWTAERYGVKSTPTFKFFCNGKPVQEMVGAIYPAILKKMVDEVIIHGRDCAENSTLIDYDITGYG
jgi:thioredoxin 1